MILLLEKMVLTDYNDFQDELYSIGKRPDLLVFKKEDFNEDLDYDISNIPHSEITEYV